MKLTRYSDYALRVSLYLAINQARLVQISEIVKVYGLPQGNIMKLTTDLVGAGFFESVRGRTGGIRLAISPSELTVGQIVRHTEGSQALVDCSSCILAPECGLICIMSEAKQAFFRVLDGYTLEQVIARNPKAIDILSLTGGE
ncbi:MAG: Rrf2 family transcriptional regulator [Donghicola eburneus]|jgi:Rrf2 family nitric oxide-sensitive transcriptional repressor|nr:Rrf2 family transcriptional regulator [Donghicola eburneus]MCI5041503.1 Rrf2 family transcriptional regulator [Donghicola eburneus]